MKTFIPLKQRLAKEIAETLKKELHETNVHALPRITKVIVNVGLSQKKYSSKEMQQFIAESLATITGQKPAIRKARMSISNFNIRENMVVGMCTTLRGNAMYHFLDRLLCVALPRVRDFRGLTPKLDGRGNYSIGLVDQSIFPEIAAPEANKIFGLQIQITTNAQTDERGLALLKAIGVPLRKPTTKKESSVDQRS